ncbi:hypothetical protein B0O99DRAFT_696463 [Bisporella sp. PMI_857]|nr:hypothetical protein B0O99DRAFT_696463 [Bisporella sp. PMI_857]
MSANETVTTRLGAPNTFASPAIAAGYEEQLPAMTAAAKKAITLAPPITSDSVIHDNACGPGIITSAILSQFQESTILPPKIIATDIAPEMVKQAAKKGPSVNAQVMDAKNLDKIQSNFFTHSFTNFLFVRGWQDEDMVTFASEIYRTLLPGATAVKAAWELHQWQDVVEDALKQTRDDITGLMAGQPWTEEKVRTVFIKAGFDPKQVVITHFEYIPDVPIDWDSIVWQELLAAINGWVTRDMSDEEKKRYKDNLHSRINEDKKNPKVFKWGAWILTAVK